MKAGAVILLFLLFPCSFAWGADPADLVFLNGAVYTVDTARSWASALAVTGDRISYVGEDAIGRSFIGPKTRVVNLHQRMLLPGFQDSHVHPGMVANPDTYLNLAGLVRREDVLEKIRQFAKTHPEQSWIQGGGWDEAAFLPDGLPTRQMLDSVVSNRPAYLVNNSGHGGWANTAALAAAGITSKTPDPANGRLQRDASGQPAGVLHEESAMALVEAVIPPSTEAERTNNLSAALKQMERLGITALEDAMATSDIAASYKTLDQRGELRQRINLCLPFDPAREDDAQIQEFIDQRADLAGPRLQATCVKLFLDGAYGSHTVVLLEPYSDKPATYGKGTLFIERQRLNRLVTRLDAEGFRIHVHAQGDGAVRAALDAFAIARETNGFRDNRHTIAHLCLIDADDIPRFRELGVIANFTPLWSLGDVWETVFAPRLFGPERSQRIFQTRTLLGAGAMIVWGSDWDVTGVSPLDGLETATTHRYPGGIDLEGKTDSAWSPSERLNLEQAIVAYTSAGAYLMHASDARGTLAAGQLADVVVLEKNLFDMPALEIHTVQVDMAVISGEVVFERQ